MIATRGFRENRIVAKGRKICFVYWVKIRRHFRCCDKTMTYKFTDPSSGRTRISTVFRGDRSIQKSFDWMTEATHDRGQRSCVAKESSARNGRVKYSAAYITRVSRCFWKTKKNTQQESEWNDRYLHAKEVLTITGIGGGFRRFPGGGVVVR